MQLLKGLKDFFKDRTLIGVSVPPHLVRDDIKEEVIEMYHSGVDREKPVIIGIEVQKTLGEWIAEWGV